MIALFCVSGVAAIAFVYVQARVARLPLLPISLSALLTCGLCSRSDTIPCRFKNYNICLILLQTFLVGIVYYGNSKLCASTAYN